MCEEDDVVAILSKIEDNASNEEIEHALYEFRGLLCKEESRIGIGPFVSCYLLLRESREYQGIALSLTHFIMKDVRVCNKELLEQLHGCLKIRGLSESRIQIPKLLLRCALSAVASHLDKAQGEQFVSFIADMYLKVHPDRFGDSYRMLKLFEMMEDRQLLDETLSLVRETLQMVKRSDVVKKIIDIYNPKNSVRIITTKGRENIGEPLCPGVVSTLLDVANEKVLTNTCSKEITVKSLVLKHSTQIQQSLNFVTLLPMFTNPCISFLTQEDLDFVMKPLTDTQRANHLLQLLTRKPISSSRKFLVCLWLAREHLGHEDLFCMLWPNLSKTEVALITDMCRQASYASLVSVDTPPSFTELQGDLTQRSFRKIENLLWDNFGRGDYQTIAKITSRLKDSPSQEWSIVGKWFNAINCMFVHSCKDHNYCIQNVLEPVLEQCEHPSVLNRNILEGRIRLRLAQVYLLSGNKQKAVENSEKARQLLSLTCGYDVAKLLLREAKVMSATQPQRKVEIEAMYLAALHNFDEDHVCCKPTAHLSLAAFYLNISFGSKPNPKSAVCIPPQDDIRKAKGQLEALDRLGLFLPSLRQCERNLLIAEILRLEDKFEAAHTLFSKTVEDSHKTGLMNIVAIAEHRCMMIKQSQEKSKFIDELLTDIEELML